MQPWQIAALCASLLIAGHYLTLRAASGKIGVRGDVPTTRTGLVFSVLSGLCITGASILLFSALRKGGPVAATGTIVLGGGVALSALVAPFLFREPITARRVAGVALGLAAMIVLSTERG
jgi:uncharacterized membrane protein